LHGKSADVTAGGMGKSRSGRQGCRETASEALGRSSTGDRHGLEGSSWDAERRAYVGLRRPQRLDGQGMSRRPADLAADVSRARQAGARWHACQYTDFGVRVPSAAEQRDEPGPPTIVRRVPSDRPGISRVGTSNAGMRRQAPGNGPRVVR